MFYIRIGAYGAGLTNQLFSLITGIIISKLNNQKCVVVDQFRDDMIRDKYSNISDIIDLKYMNDYLKKYDITIIDKYDFNFKLLKVLYGIEDNLIDITEHIIVKYVNENSLYIPKNIKLNDICGDPCPNIYKKLYLKYEINNIELNEVYNENISDDIIIDSINGNYVNTFSWINSYNREMFDDILTNIKFNKIFIENSNIFKNKIKNDKINVIHLKLEKDSIEHYSKINNIDKDSLKTLLEYKYINIIEKYIKKTDKTIILSNNYENKVIHYLKDNNYDIIFCEKYYNYREKDAINDLLISKICNNVFIGVFNFKYLSGSTFSYFISKIIKKDILKIWFDFDKINDLEVIENNDI